MTKARVLADRVGLDPSLVVSSSLQEIEDAGATAQAEARSNLAYPQTQQIFTSSSTWTKPTGCRFIEVECVGGGGGSGGTTGNASPSINAASGGGGGGAYAQAIIDVTATASAAVTIGAGGAGGATSANDGVDGGNTSFTSSVIAEGGSGSGGKTAFDYGSTPGGQGGLASNSTGDLVVNGGAGGNGAEATLMVFAGAGGASHYSGETVPGVIGNLYGGGGGGRSRITSGSAAGFAGANGICIVKEYY